MLSGSVGASFDQHMLSHATELPVQRSVRSLPPVRILPLGLVLVKVWFFPTADLDGRDVERQDSTFSRLDGRLRPEMQAKNERAPTGTRSGTCIPFLLGYRLKASVGAFKNRELKRK